MTPPAPHQQNFLPWTCAPQARHAHQDTLATCSFLQAGLVLTLLLGLAIHPVQAQTTSFFVCVDASGRRITSDRPIPECANREQREMTSSGAVRRVIAPHLTPEERALADQQSEADAARKTRDLEQQRRDRALLSRYPSQTQHDAERQRQLALQLEGTAQLDRRSEELKLQEKDIRLELEFYKSNPAKAPTWLTRKLADNADQQQQHLQLVALQLDEKRRINQRFDEELARLKQLWAIHRPTPSR